MSDETPLERLLRHAVTEPGMRPEFYRRLLDAEVLIPIEKPKGHSGNRLAPGTTVKVRTLRRFDGVEFIPFFTSAERFDDAGMRSECVRMPVRALFESRSDIYFHINPFSLYNRDFGPTDIASLLTLDGILAPIPVFIRQRATVSIGEYEDRPGVLFDALCALLARHVKVRAAYCALLTMPDEKVKRSCLIALDVFEGADVYRIFNDIGTVVTDFMVPTSLPVDLAVRPQDDTLVAQYLATAKPFYEIGLASQFLPDDPSVVS